MEETEVIKPSVIASHIVPRWRGLGGGGSNK